MDILMNHPPEMDYFAVVVAVVGDDLAELVAAEH